MNGKSVPADDNGGFNGQPQTRSVAHASISAVERSMVIIEALSDASEGLPVTELSKRLGINKALIHRILTSLVTAGYVYKDETSQNYRLTTKLMSLAFRHTRMMDIYDLLLPILRRLASETRELVELNWVHQDRMVLVAKADSPRRVRVIDYLGEEQHVHAAACGKVWLASLPEEKALKILMERGMPKVTSHTVTDLDILRMELRQVREQGYALNIQESGDEVTTIAAPVYVSRGHGPAAGAVSVVAPAFHQVHLDEHMIQLTIQAATEIGSIWPFVTIDR